MRPAPLLLLVPAALSACSPQLDWSTAVDWAYVTASDHPTLPDDPTPDTPLTWDWILGELPSAPPAVDLLGVDGEFTPQAFLDTAHAHGTLTWCYVSAGTVEDYRDDADAFASLNAEEVAAGRDPILGERYPEWPDERWLDPARSEVFLPLMEARLDQCADKGFSYVEFDNIDAYLNSTGFEVTQAEQLAYVDALVAAANDRGLGTLHKGAPDLLADRVEAFDLALLEDCHLYGFCAQAQPYLDAGKPVLDVEYPEAYRSEGVAFETAAVCAATEAAGASTLVKRLDLDTATIVCAAFGGT